MGFQINVLTSLVEVKDTDFDWFLGDEAAARPELALPTGGVEHPAVLDIVRTLTKELHSDGCRSSWMMVSDGEVVGLCSFRRIPEAGSVEIGYGVAESCRGQGHATRAVAAIIASVNGASDLKMLTAETSVLNPASSRVLEKNGFTSVGVRTDPEDGDVISWQRPLSGCRGIA